MPQQTGVGESCASTPPPAAFRIVGATRASLRGEARPGFQQPRSFIESSKLEGDAEAAPRIIPLDFTRAGADDATGAAFKAAVYGNLDLAVVVLRVAASRARGDEREQVLGRCRVRLYLNVGATAVDQIAILKQFLLNLCR